MTKRSCMNCKYNGSCVTEYPCSDCYFGANPLETTPLRWTPKSNNEPPSSNNVDHPSHYNQGGIECIDAMVAAYGKEAVSVFCLLNAFKYLWREEHKNGKEDLEKAIWYLKKRLELIKSE